MKSRSINIKLIVSDIDGVWTDNSFYYSEKGDVLRKFNTRDSYGVSLCRLAGIPILIVSSEMNKMVEMRMQKLEINFISLGIKNKLKVIENYCKNLEISLDEVAFIGDDMNDFHLIGKLGMFCCPADSYFKVRMNADLVLKTNGGSGAFREFVEVILVKENILDDLYKEYVAECLIK